MLNDVEIVDLTGWRLLALEAGKMFVPAFAFFVGELNALKK